MIAIVLTVLSALCAISGGVAAVGYILRRRWPADLTRDLLAIGGPFGAFTSTLTAAQVVETSGIRSMISLILGGILTVIVILTIFACRAAVNYCAK